jgi:hypothetical protein
MDFFMLLYLQMPLKGGMVVLRAGDYTRCGSMPLKKECYSIDNVCAREAFADLMLLAL